MIPNPSKKMVALVQSKWRDSNLHLPHCQYIAAILLSISSINAYADKSCSITASIVFGAYDPISNTDLNSVGNIDLYCDGNTSVVLKLGLGNGTGASFYGGRRMRASGGNLLIYNIYTDSSHRHVLGDGTGGSVTLPVQGKFGFSRAIYGSIPANQRGLSASSYSDLLVITIVY